MQRTRQRGGQRLEDQGQEPASRGRENTSRRGHPHLTESRGVAYPTGIPRPQPQKRRGDTTQAERALRNLIASGMRRILRQATVSSAEKTTSSLQGVQAPRQRCMRQKHAKTDALTTKDQTQGLAGLPSPSPADRVRKACPDKKQESNVLMGLSLSTPPRTLAKIVPPCGAHVTAVLNPGLKLKRAAMFSQTRRNQSGNRLRHATRAARNAAAENPPPSGDKTPRMQ